MHSDDDLHSTCSEDETGAVGGGRADTVRDPEEWEDYWSEELVTLYHCVQDRARGMGAYVLDACTFHDFAPVCWRHSSGRKPPC